MYSHDNENRRNGPGDITQAINLSKDRRRTSELERAMKENQFASELLIKNKKMEEALIFYRDEAKAISENMAIVNTDAVMASVRVLQLDAGKRATDAMA